MNILFCYDKPFNRANGGIATVSLNLINALREKGYCCYCVSVLRTNKEDCEGQYYLPNETTKLNDEVNYRWFRTFIKEKSIDVIINQNGNTPKSIWPIEWAKDLHIGRITVYHSGFFSLFQCNDDRVLNNSIVKNLRLRNFVNKLWLRLFRIKYGSWFRRQINLSHRVVTLSSKYHPELEWFSRIKTDERFVSIYNSVPDCYSNKLLIGGKKKNLLFVGRLSGEKRVDYLLEIWSKVCHSHPDWGLVIVGDGILRPQLEQMAKNMGLPRVHFEGYTDPLDYYDSSSIFCLTSSTEGFALVLVEAMSCGCVPIAFNSYACATDIIDDEKNGYLIEPFDINKYSQRLTELMDDENIGTILYIFYNHMKYNSLKNHFKRGVTI